MKLRTKRPKLRRSGKRITPSDRRDPTRTRTLRRKMEEHLGARFAQLKGRVLKLLVQEDALGAKNRSPMPSVVNVLTVRRKDKLTEAERMAIEGACGTVYYDQETGEPYLDWLTYNLNPYHDERGRFASATEGAVSLARKAWKGGFTYKPLVGSSPHVSYVVSLDRGAGWEQPLNAAEFSSARVKEYLAKVRDAVRRGALDPDKAHVGAWKDDKTGRIVLDVNEVYGDKKEAIDAGRKRKQDAIFDLGGLKEIDLRPKGTSTFSGNARQDHGGRDGRGPGGAGAANLFGVPGLTAKRVINALKVDDRQPVLAVDFDGRIAEAPDQDKPMAELKPRPGSAAAMRAFRDAGIRVIIWTASKEWQLVPEWCHRHGIVFDELNDNAEDENGSRKIQADMYLDDRGEGEPDASWPDLVRLVFRRFGIGRTKVRQPTDDRKELFLLADRALTEMRELLNQTGFEQFDIDALPVGGVERLCGEPGGVVLVAPVKGRERAEEKVEKYGGDWSRMFDIVRATVACDSMADLRRAMDAVGGEVVRRKDRFAAPLSNGYRDVLANLKLPCGMIVEVQFHLKPMLAAREQQHVAYAVVRTIRRSMREEGRRRMTQAEKDACRQVKRTGRELLAKAWAECQAADPTLNALDVQGGELPNMSVKELREHDFITLPDGVTGTNCMVCCFVRKDDRGHYCGHEDLRGQRVNERNCCALWDAAETLRAWKTTDNAWTDVAREAALAARHARRMMDALKDSVDRLPATAWRKIRMAVSRKYAALSARYGSRWAKVIVGTAIVTFPTPFTMGAVAVMTGLAELHRRFRGVHNVAGAVDDVLGDGDGMGAARNRGMDGAEVESAARRLVEEMTREITGREPTANKQRFASVQFDVTDPEVADAVRRIQAALDPADVLKLDERPHVTARYGLHDDSDIDRVRKLLAGTGPVSVRLGALSAFHSDEEDVLKLEVESQQLHNINRRLKLLPGTDLHPTFNPHLTVAYLNPGTAGKCLDLPNPLKDRALTFTSATFSTRARTMTSLTINPFVSRQQQKACYAKDDPRWDCKEWSRATKGKKLPKKKPTENTRWSFHSDPDKVAAFKAWLAGQVADLLTSATEDELWKRYVQQGFLKGQGRSFDDVRTRHPDYMRESVDFFRGTREEFLRSAFYHPVSVDKVKLLAGRAFDELRNVTADMSNKMVRSLADGLTRGESPRTIARDMNKAVDLGRNRSLLVARTEIVRAHAEGQLVALKKLGVKKLGVMVEFSNTGDDLVCPDCEELGGTVYDINEASGIIPQHPQCRCAWLPAGNPITGNRREPRITFNEVATLNAAIDRFWARHRTWNARARNAFCPTGPGGGVDPSCSPRSADSGVPPPPEAGTELEVQRSYIRDADRMAHSEFVLRRINRLHEKMYDNDERWSKTHEAVAAIGDRLDRLEAVHTKETEKMAKMMDDDVAAIKAADAWDGKMRVPTPHSSEEYARQGEKCDEALGKFLKERREATEKAWSIIKRANDNPERRFSGENVIQQVKLREDYPRYRPLDAAQKLAVADVEKRLSGVLSSRYQQRIDETNVYSISEKDEQRAYFKGGRHGAGESGIYLPINGRSEDTVAHELGHSLETNANLQAAAQGFLYSRVGTEDAKPMGSGYKSWEVGRDDRFSKAFGSSARYVGKHYKTDDTEVTSMGLEKMFSDPVHFAKKDPQYFKFVLGVLDGSFT